jgi:hypothetical protein
VVFGGLEHEPRYTRAGAAPAGARRILESQGGNRRLTKSEVWKVYWHINTMKVSLLLMRCRNSITKHERDLYRRICEAWEM